MLTRLKVFGGQQIAWLYQLARGPLTPAAQAAALERELDTEALGRSAGSRNLPAPDATADPNEALITEHARMFAADQHHAHQHRLNAISPRLEDLADRLSPAALGGQASAARDALVDLAAHVRDILSELSHRLGEAGRELTSFRDQNKLHHRLARPAKPLVAIAVFGLLAAVTEGALNAWAFAQGAVGGWREALLTATVLAALNIGGGLAGGAAAGNLVHIKLHRKALGLLTTAIYVMFALELTALGARYRTALAIDPDNAAALAAEHIGQIAFQVGDFHTALLVLASLAFSGLAFASGLLASDIYPSYSAVCERYQRRQSALRDARRDFASRATDLTDSFLAAVDASVYDARRARAEYPLVIESGLRVISEHNHAMQQARSLHERLIHSYRRAVLAVRDPNLPLPPYYTAPIDNVTQGLALETCPLETAQAKLLAAESIEADFQCAAAAAKAEIYQLRAEHASGLDAFFRSAEGLDPSSASQAVVHRPAPVLAVHSTDKPSGGAALRSAR